MTRLMFMLRIFWGTPYRFQYLTGAGLQARSYNPFTDKVKVQFDSWGRGCRIERLPRAEYLRIASEYQDTAY